MQRRQRFSTGALCILTLTGVGAACQNARSGEAQVRPDPLGVQGPLPLDAGPVPTVTAAQSTDKVGIDVAGVHMTLTLADGEAIRAALLARLRSQPFIEDRDYLINGIAKVPASIEEGLLCIGSWVLETRRDKLELSVRMPPGPVAIQVYFAPVERHGSAWVVGDVEQGQIRGLGAR